MTASVLGLAMLAIQPAPEPAEPPTDIIVTGERVPRKLSETASSVAVLTRADLEGAAADRIEQALELVPNVQLGGGSDAPAIRGQDTTGVLHDLPAFLGGNRPRTTLQVDGRAVSYNEFTYGASPLWDVSRVEVFRSPQTTTQGRNSIAGAIFVQTENPGHAFAGRARAILGEFDTRQYSAALDVPLARDQLAVRASGDLRRSRASSTIARNANGGPDPNADNFGQLRVKLLAEPAAIPSARLLLTYVHTQAHAPQIEGVDHPFEDRQDLDATYGIFRTNVDSLTGNFQVQLTPSVGVETTVSAGDTRARRFAPRGFGETRIRGRDASGELIVRWRAGPPIEGIAGVHAVRTTLDQTIDLSAARLGIGLFDDLQKSAGIFGEASWRATDRLKLTGGLRYQFDRQDRSGSLAALSGPVPLDFHRSFDAWLPKLAIEYSVSPAFTAGLLAQRAYNPGGTTLDLRLRAADDFDAERLWDFELFTRASLAGDRVSLRSNLFYYAMTNAQRPQELELQTPGGTVRFLEIENAPRARTYGLETDLAWRVDDRLSVRAGIGLLSTRITRTLTPDDPLLGKSFQRSPAFSAAAAIDWRPRPELRLTVGARRNSGYFSDDEETAETRIGGATTVNARAAWSHRHFVLFGYARNLLDEFYLTSLTTPISGTAGDPRELGFGLEARF